MIKKFFNRKNKDNVIFKNKQNAENEDTSTISELAAEEFSTEQLYLGEIENISKESAKTLEKNIEDTRLTDENGKSTMTDDYNFGNKAGTIAKFTPNNIDEVIVAIKYFSRHGKAVIDFSKLKNDILKHSWAFTNGAVVALNGKVTKIQSKNYKIEF